MKKWYLFLLAILVLPGRAAFGQDQTAQYEVLELVDQPTAGMLEKGEYGFSMRFYPYGGALGVVRAGLFNRFMIGVSYGGRNIIGRGDPEMNELPGVLIKYRLFEETDLPAICIGFDSQGYGLWLDNKNRYEIKAKGVFAVASKNFSLGWLGTLGMHGGINYNAFEGDDDANMDGFIGLDKSLNEEISLVTEYDLGLDDNNAQAFGRNRGYLNAGLRWIFAKQLSLEFNFKDLLENQKDVASISRELRISYVETF
ncbi:MAG: hypothetical protein NTW14_08265 [bacterium]|nr:hypothetical protein [bacterium]